MKNENITFYRGESKKYDISCLPSLMRYVNGDNQLLLEQQYYLLCKEYIQRIGFINEKDTINIKTLGFLQHYGFDTRLLDISKSNEVALFFAACANFNDDGYIFDFLGSKKNNLRYYKNSDIESIKRKIECIIYADRLQDRDLISYFKKTKKKINKSTIENNAILDYGKIYNENIDNIRYIAQRGAFILPGNILNEKNQFKNKIQDIKPNKSYQVKSYKKIKYLYDLCCENKKIKIGNLVIENDFGVCYITMFPDDDFSLKVISYYLKISNEILEKQKKHIFINFCGYLLSRYTKNNFLEVNEEKIENSILYKEIISCKEKFYFFSKELNSYINDQIVICGKKYNMEIWNKDLKKIINYEN